MEFKNLKSSKIIKLILLDIFPSIEDLKNQDKSGLSIIFHGINMFYDLEELISQKKEIIINPNQNQITVNMSIVKTTDILSTRQMLIKKGSQWVTFSFENKDKISSSNFSHNLIDCIKINIFCEILNKNQNNSKQRNNSIEFPEKKENRLYKKSDEHFKKISKQKKNKSKKAHNISQEHCNNELIESYNNFNTSNKKRNNPKEFSLEKQILSTITKDHNKKYELNTSNNNINNSLNCLYKQLNNNFYSIKKVNTQSNVINKKFKKRVNTSAMNISGVESKTINYNLNSSNCKKSCKPKIDIKEENLSSTLKNFNFNNNRRNNIFKKYISSPDENNPNFQNYSINIDELLSDKITEHVNIGKNLKKNNCLSTYFDKNKFKKINTYKNNLNNLNNKSMLNKLVHAKTKTTNFINVNLNNTEIPKCKNELKNKKSKTKHNTNISHNHINLNNSQKYISEQNNPLIRRKNNIINLEITTNNFVEENNRDKSNKYNYYFKDKKDICTVSTKQSKKIMFSQELTSDSNIIAKNNKSPCYTNLSYKSTDRINNETENENYENEFNIYNKIKEDFMLVYNDEYIQNIQEDLLKLEIELFIEKITELIRVYHSQIDLQNMEHEIMKNNYRNNVKRYLFQWKLYNKLQYIKVLNESKVTTPFIDKKQIEENNINKVNLNQKEMIIFKTLFSDNENKINKDEKKILLKDILLNALGNNDKNILLWILKNNKYKNWIQENINYFSK